LGHAMPVISLHQGLVWFGGGLNGLHRIIKITEQDWILVPSSVAYGGSLALNGSLRLSATLER
jgi:hypothetical protein